MTALDVKSRVATIADAATILGLTVPAVRRLVEDGTLRTVTLGGRRRYVPVRELERFAEEVAG